MIIHSAFYQPQFISTQILISVSLCFVLFSHTYFMSFFSSTSDRTSKWIQHFMHLMIQLDTRLLQNSSKILVSFPRFHWNFHISLCQDHSIIKQMIVLVCSKHSAISSHPPTYRYTVPFILYSTMRKDRCILEIRTRCSLDLVTNNVRCILEIRTRCSLELVTNNVRCILEIRTRCSLELVTNTFPLLGIRTNTSPLLEFRTNTRMYSAPSFGHSSQAQTGHFLQSIIFNSFPSIREAIYIFNSVPSIREAIYIFRKAIQHFSAFFSTKQQHPTNQPIKSTASDQSSQRHSADKHISFTVCMGGL